MELLHILVHKYVHAGVDFCLGSWNIILRNDSGGKSGGVPLISLGFFLTPPGISLGFFLGAPCLDFSIPNNPPAVIGAGGERSLPGLPPPTIIGSAPYHFR